MFGGTAQLLSAAAMCSRSRGPDTVLFALQCGHVLRVRKGKKHHAGSQKQGSSSEAAQRLEQAIWAPVLSAAGEQPQQLLPHMSG